MGSSKLGRCGTCRRAAIGLASFLVPATGCRTDTGSLGSESSSGTTGETTGSATLPASTSATTTADSTVTSTASTDAPSTETTSSSNSTNSTSGAGSSSSSSSTTGAPADPICDEFGRLVASLPAMVDEADRSAAASTFMREAAYSDAGIPLRCDGQLVFFANEPVDPEADVHVAGEFNGWDATADVLTPVVGTDAFRFVRISINEDAHGLYKLVFGAADFRADPWARRFGWDRNGEYSLTQPRPGLSHIERWPSFEPADVALLPRDLTVYVPPVRGGDSYPVVYMHDGQNVFNPEAVWGGWQAKGTADAIIAESATGPFFIVGLSNTPQRLAEYTHVPDDIGAGVVGGDASRYADFLVDEVLPFIESRYDVATLPTGRAVAGSSLGGLVSAYIAHRHQDTFGFAAAMSGTFGWGSLGAGNPTLSQIYADGPAFDIRFYVDSGGEGPCPDGGLDNYCATIEFADTLRSLGWTDGADLDYRWDPGAPHNEAAWAGRLGEVFEIWLGG